MLQVAFAGTFAARLEQPARRHLAVPCEIIGWTDGMIEARAELIAENIRRISCGETPLNLVSR